MKTTGMAMCEPPRFETSGRTPPPSPCPVGRECARSANSSWRVRATRGRVIDVTRPSERPRLARHPLAWLQARDRDLAVLRRAGRAAIVMPGLFALGDKVLAN